MGVDLLNVKGLQALDPLAPVVMVNLMRFRERSLDGDGSGWDAYLRYSALTVPMIKARGGTLLWTGDAKAVALGEDGNNGTIWRWCIIRRGRLHRHDDVGGLRTALRPAPHQRLRRARHHRDQGGLQQVQDGVESRECERSEAIHRAAYRIDGLLRRLSAKLLCNFVASSLRNASRCRGNDVVRVADQIRGMPASLILRPFVGFGNDQRAHFLGRAAADLATGRGLQRVFVRGRQHRLDLGVEPFHDVGGVPSEPATPPGRTSYPLTPPSCADGTFGSSLVRQPR